MSWSSVMSASTRAGFSLSSSAAILSGKAAAWRPHSNAARLNGTATLLSSMARLRLAAQRLDREAVEIERHDAARRGLDLAHRILLTEIEIAVEDEICDRRVVRIDDGEAALRRHQGQRLARRADDAIRRQQQIGMAERDMRRGDVLAALPQPDMRNHRAALLREAGHVLHQRAHAVERRRHADDAADREHAGAADAGDR